MNQQEPDIQIVEMFDAISPTYDLANRLLSFGFDASWRRRCIRALGVAPNQHVLDCAAGTGDMAATVCRKVSDIELTLLDPSDKMLKLARTKLSSFSQAQRHFVKGGAEALPFPSESFHRIMVAFGFRNFKQLDKGLAELFRVTKRGGRGAILEFTPDRKSLFQPFFRFYFSHIIQKAGAMISGDARAYTYLKTSIRDFPTSDKLCERLTRIGWNVKSCKKLTGGIVSLFVLEKI